MIDFTLQQLVLRLCALVFIAGVHGASVAGLACALGDQGPRYDRRLRLNPLVHLDLLGTVSGVLFLAGWMKPIAIDPAELRQGRIGLVVDVVLINVLPIPCLTGGHILTAVKPMWRDRFRRSQPYAALLLTLLAALGVVTGALEPAYRALAGSVLGE